MNGKTIKFLRNFYSTFYHREPGVFEKHWKQIKRSWKALSAPERKVAGARMRNMLVRYEKAMVKARRALPNLTAIQEASKLLQEKGLPTNDIPSAIAQPQSRRLSSSVDDQTPGGHSLGGL